MGRPELLGGSGAFHQLGGAQGQVAAGQRTVAEDIAQALAELVANFGDTIVGSPAIGAGVAPVFDEGDRRAIRPAAPPAPDRSAPESA